MVRTATFAIRIKEYRTINDFTLAEMESKIGVPAQTINRYELGQRVPKIDTAIEIADALNINPLWLQGYNVDIKKSSPVTEGEVLDESERHLLDLYRKLNPEGQEILADYADTLVSSGKYIKSDASGLGQKKA